MITDPGVHAAPNVIVLEVPVTDTDVA